MRRGSKVQGGGHTGPFQEFGVLRLPLKPGTTSGYVSVQHSQSQKRPGANDFDGYRPQRAQCGQLQESLGCRRCQGKGKWLQMATHSPDGRKQAVRKSGMELRRAPTECLLECLYLSLSQCCSHCSARFALDACGSAIQTVNCRGPHIPHAAWRGRHPFFERKWQKCAA